MRATTHDWRERTLRRFIQLQLGLCLFGLGITLMLGANIGLDPWSAFHQGLSTHSGLTFGRVTQLIGLALIVISYMAFRERPGLGTVFNMGVIGPWVDLFRDQPWCPEATDWLVGTAQFLGGMVLMGFAVGLYIAAQLGAGPRDGFVLGMARRSGKSVRFVRVAMEAIVLVGGWVLGAPIGAGTVIFALGMGPLMQTFLRVFGMLKPPDPER